MDDLTFLLFPVAGFAICRLPMDGKKSFLKATVRVVTHAAVLIKEDRAVPALLVVRVAVQTQCGYLDGEVALEIGTV